MNLRTALLITALVATSAVTASAALAAPPAPAPAPVVSTEPTDVVAGTLGVPPKGQGQIVFYRPSFMGMAVAWTVQEDDKAIAKLGSSSYAIVLTTPGKHTYYVKSETTDKFNIEVDEGETYYVKETLGMGLITSRVHLNPAEASDFASSVHKMHVAKPVAP